METEQTRKLEQGALDILSTLRGNGFEAYWAGGCVRDRLLGRLPQDVDIVTSARPDQIPPLFPKTVAIGKAFGVIGVVHDETLYEVATFRTEQGFSDGRRPDTAGRDREIVFLVTILAGLYVDKDRDKEGDAVSLRPHRPRAGGERGCAYANGFETD